MFKKEAERVPKVKAGPAEQVRAPSAKGEECSILSAGLKLTGSLECDGDIEVYGKVEGEIKSRSLIVGESARIEGSISADTVQIFGSVKGPVTAKTVKIAQSGRVAGDITYESMSMDEGSVVTGHCGVAEPAKARSDVEVVALNTGSAVKGNPGPASEGASGEKPTAG